MPREYFWYELHSSRMWAYLYNFQVCICKQLHGWMFNFFWLVSVKICENSLYKNTKKINTLLDLHEMYRTSCRVFYEYELLLIWGFTKKEPKQPLFYPKIYSKSTAIQMVHNFFIENILRFVHFQQSSLIQSKNHLN